MTLSECQRGYMILQVYPCDRGVRELWKVESRRIKRGQPWETQPEGFYYQGGYVDMIRGVDYP